MRRRRDFLSALGARLDMPSEALPHGFGLSLSGQNELTVRGCRRILEYGDSRMCLELGKCRLAVLGEGLICTAFLPETLTVCGSITALSFEEGKA